MLGDSDSDHKTSSTMSKIYVRSNGLTSWQRLLAEPEKHWREGFSAMSLAAFWEAANGVPPEIDRLFRDCSDFCNDTLELLVAFPEWKVPLPGWWRASQNDVFALLRCGDYVIATMIKGKVSETFGPTVGEWLVRPTSGKHQRLEFICGVLGIDRTPPDNIRYQLLHRTASEFIEARRFGTTIAAMVVHSFSPDAAWFDDFAAISKMLGTSAEVGRLNRVSTKSDTALYLGWAKGCLRSD